MVSVVLLGVTACGNDAGASGGTLQAPAAKNSALSGPADQAPKSALGALVALPRGYVADPRNATGAFTATSFLNSWSADPALDRALLLNASFVEGYRATRVSPDQKKHFTIQLFKAGTPAKAKVLQKGFWSQDTHEHSFDVPDALSDARVEFDGGTQQSVAVAESSFVVGSLVAELSVRELGAVGSNLTPDTGLITTLTKQQRTRLTATSS